MALKIGEVMTHGAHTIGKEQPLAVAHQRMQSFSIRHLPVLEGGKVVGLVSMGDLHLLETLKDVDPNLVRVEEAMTSDVYVVGPETPVAEVAGHMAERKLGSAVVVDPSGEVMGVFTTVDALHTLALELREKEAGAAAAPRAPRPPRKRTSRPAAQPAKKARPAKKKAARR